MLLPAGVSTSPMTYIANRKYIVVAVSAAIAGRAGGAEARIVECARHTIVITCSTPS